MKQHCAIRGNVQQGKSGKALVPGACIIDLRRQQRLYLPWTPPSVLSSERRAALDHCRSLESLGVLKGAVIIFDRGYYSQAMFRYFSENGYRCVMRLKENLKLVKKCTGDSILSIEFEDAASGQLVSIPVRVLSIDLGNGTTEYLATNLFDKAYTAEDFKELYFMRWNLMPISA